MINVRSSFLVIPVVVLENVNIAYSYMNLYYLDISFSAAFWSLSVLTEDAVGAFWQKTDWIHTSHFTLRPRKINRYVVKVLM